MKRNVYKHSLNISNRICSVGQLNEVSKWFHHWPSLFPFWWTNNCKNSIKDSIKDSPEHDANVVKWLDDESEQKLDVVLHEVWNVEDNVKNESHNPHESNHKWVDNVLEHEVWNEHYKPDHEVDERPDNAPDQA